MPNLYDRKRGDRVRLLAHISTPPGAQPLFAGMILTLDHIDGMYSLCRDEAGRIVHPVAWSEVEVVARA